MVSEQELALIASESTFKKGQGIYQQGNVHLQVASETELTGFVSGTYDYKVSAQENSRGCSFSCTCPAFEYQEVCKHCVALVLAYNRGEQLQPSAIKRDDVLKNYLKSLSTEQLCNALYGFICEDNSQYTRWLTKAELAVNQSDLKSLKKLVTKALPLKNIWEYSLAADYFMNAGNSISDLIDAAEKISPTDNLKLIFHIYERLEKVFERVDDSGGFRFGVQSKITDALPVALARQDWEVDKRARWLVDALDFEYESFPEIPAGFNLTAAEMQAFLTLCQSQFDSMEVDADVGKREYDYSLKQRGQILLDHLPQAKEFEFALKIKSKMVCNLRDALDVSEFCLEHNDELTAEDWLLIAKKLISAPHDQTRWDIQAIEVYAALGEKKRAWRIAWQRFVNSPSFYSWKNLQENIEVVGWAPDSLKNDVEKVLLEACHSGSRPLSSKENMVYFYLSEGEFDKAIVWVDNNKTDEHALKEAAIKLSEKFPVKAIEYATKALTIMLRFADNRSYQDAISLLQKLDKLLPDTEDVYDQFESLVANIAKENRRRPNMMELLRAEFGQYLE